MNRPTFAFRQTLVLAFFVACAIAACGGTSSGGGFGLNGGPGGGSALCGPNGTNACAPTQYCDVTLGCVACLNNTNCPAAAPYCSQGACVECDGALGCGSTATPVCYPATHTCHAACTNNQSCMGRGMICDTATGACVGCVTAMDCTGGAKICAPTTQQCVACASNGDCPTGAPRCLASQGACVACLTNADCGTAEPVCDPGTFRCRMGCTSDATCKTPASHCDVATSTCVQCNASSDCAGTSTPVCSPGHVCVACAANSDCSAATPYCRQRVGLGLLEPAACVECLMDSQCPAAHPTCNANACGG
jgi:hypothetical protein